MKTFFSLLLLLLLAACNVLQPPPDLAWDHDPETMIIRVTNGGGLEPAAAVYNRIPNGQVWGDGRIVWTSRGENGERLVWQGQLSEAEMTALLQTFADKGFWRLKDFYEPREQIFDSSTTSVTVNLLVESKRVSEYHSGAPRAFHELAGRVASGAGVAGTPYEPQRGYLTANPTQPWADLDTAVLPVWEAEAAGLSLDEALSGAWVEGPALAQAWEAVNRKYWGPLIAEEDRLYELYLEIPELTGREPD